MGTAASRQAELEMDCAQAGLLARQRLLQLGWRLHHEEELHTKDGRRLAIAFGTTTPFGGATAGSLFMRGAASVAFLLRIEETAPARTLVHILAGGTEGWAGQDWGRSHGVAGRFLRGLGDA